MTKLGFMNPVIWDRIVEQLFATSDGSENLEESFTVTDWKIVANKRKLSREMDEKYGPLKDIILHPMYQSMKQYLEDNITFEFTLGEPMIPAATAIIVLYMMHKRLDNNILFLVGCILFNINPLYVVVAAIFWIVQSLGNKTPKGFVKTTALTSDYKSYTSQVAQDLYAESEKSYDHVLVGNDISTLYTAALLSRAGHTCCVMRAKGVAPSSVHPEGTPCPVPLRNFSVTKVEKYQSLLDTVQMFGNGKMVVEERIKFSPIGSASNSYAHAVLKSGSHTTVLRTGEGVLAEDLATDFSIDKGIFTQFFQSITDPKNNFTSYLIEKIAPSAPGSIDAQTKEFVDLASTTIDNVLNRYSANDQNGDDIAGVISLLAAFVAGEALCPAECSTIALSTFFSNYQSGGVFYADGGYAAVESVLTKVVRKYGGAVYSDVPVAAIEVVALPSGGYQATGVRVSSSDGRTVEVKGARSVISGLGVLCTYTRMLPVCAVAESAAAALSDMSEAQPKVQLVYWLQGSAEELGLSDVDYVEMEAGNSKAGGGYTRIWSPSSKDKAWASSGSLHTLVVELELAEPLVAAHSHSFHESAPKGPLVFRPTVDCAQENPCALVMSLNKGRQELLKEKALKKIKEVYPKVPSRISHMHVVPPSMGGHRLSCSPAKYSTALGVAVPGVSGLFLCGADLALTGAVSEIQSGWAAANAALGYSKKDLSGVPSRNVIADLAAL